MDFHIRLKTIRTLALSLALLLSGIGIGYVYGNNPTSASSFLQKRVVNTQNPSEYKDVDFSLFWEVWQKLSDEYLDSEKIDTEEMVYGAISGMVASVGDPYTAFLPPEDQQRTNEELQGSFGGVGIQLGYIDQQLAVIAPLAGMPAESEGVLAGDLILNIRDEAESVDVDTNGMSLPEAVSYIRGENGSSVNLLLYRPDVGGQPFEVEITRDTIIVPSVELEIVEDERGVFAHLSLYKFGGRTDDEWKEAVDEIVERGVDGVVLDLRNNPGGFLNGAIFVASEFIDSGLVVRQQGKFNTDTFSVNRRGKLTKMPLVVLVNRGSASSSEIVAGALRDRKGVLLVGQNTFGKGTVQNAEELRGGTGIHVTVARWLLPGGGWIHESGLEPDIEASDSAATVDVDEIFEAGVNAL